MTFASDIEPQGSRGHWQGWIYQTSTRELVYKAASNYRYHVDLDTCTTQHEMLDWIDHLAGKTWATDECLAGFVRALFDLVPFRSLER